MSRNSLALYRLPPAAQSDLEEMWLYSADRRSIDQADRYIHVLEEAFELLRIMPGISRERTEFDPPVRIHPSAEHVIVYRIDADCLTILRILGGSQNWQMIVRALRN